MIKVVLFDLGGVLVKLSPLSKIFGSAIAGREHDFWGIWLHSETVRRFETGCSTLEEFIADIQKELDLPYSETELMQRHRNFVEGMYAGAYDLLEQLRNNYVLASLSNNNPVHWPIMMDDYDLADRFDHHFPSHQTGLIKPDSVAYENVINTLGVAANEIFFIDDNIINVDAAKVLGISAHVTKGIDELTDLLIQQNMVA